MRRFPRRQKGLSSNIPVTGMFEKNDRKFLQVLESPEAFEKLLKQLRLARKSTAIRCAFSLVSFLVVLWMSNHLALKTSPELYGLILMPTVMLFFFPLIFLIKAYSAHAEIRTLLVFQKLSALAAGLSISTLRQKTGVDSCSK